MLPLPPTQQMLVIEAPSIDKKKNMCVFHLTSDHDGVDCPKMKRFIQLTTTKEVIEEVVYEVSSSNQYGDCTNGYLEFEHDDYRGGDVYITLDDATCATITRSHQHSNQKGTPNPPKVLLTQASATSKGGNASQSVVDNSSKNPIVAPIEDLPGTFDIVEFYKNSKVQISQAEYLRMNPKELDRLIEYVRPRHSKSHASLDKGMVSSQGSAMDITSSSKMPSLSTSNANPNPFYVSLFVNGFRVNNCIIDLGASDNVMPIQIAKALGLEMTRTFVKYYSMDSK